MGVCEISNSWILFYVEGFAANMFVGVAANKMRCQQILKNNNNNNNNIKLKKDELSTYGDKMCPKPCACHMTIPIHLTTVKT